MGPDGDGSDKQKNLLKSAGYRGGDTGTRTLDPMIKSHLLYQLSYVPKTGPGNQKYYYSFPMGRAIF